MNKIGQNDFNKRVDFEYAFIQEPIIEGDTISVVVRDLIVIEHSTKETYQVTFYGVAKSIRQITQYVLKDGEEVLGDNVTINDGPFHDTQEAMYNYMVDGVFESREGWKGYIGWDIQAERYEIAFKQ